jgi:hypothetical protein
VALEGRPYELGIVLEGCRVEPGFAEAGVSGGGVDEGVEEGIEKGFGEGGAAMVDVGAGRQATQLGVAVGVGQMGEADGVTRGVNAAATDRVLRGSAVATVRPVRRSQGRFRARVWHTRRDDRARSMVAELASECGGRVPGR